MDIIATLIPIGIANILVEVATTEISVANCMIVTTSISTFATSQLYSRRTD